MANDEMFWLVFQLCAEKNKFVYEVVPLFGDKFTYEELEYWIVFNIIDRAKINKVDYKALPMDEVTRLCDEAESRKRAKYAKGSVK